MADASGIDPIFDAAFKKLVRGERATLSGVLHDFGSKRISADTAVDCHTYCIQVDGNGRPLIKDFAAELLSHLLDYAVPRSEVQAAYSHYERTGSASRTGRLQREAQSLLVRSLQSGEGGELLLSLIAETRLGLPQALCKMDLKTSTQMHYHGADGVHVGWDATSSKPLLFWGQSKLHKDFAGATKSCLDDLKKYLASPGGLGAADARDLQLLVRQFDLANEDLERAILSFFDAGDPKFKKYEVRGLGLIGFDSACYPIGPPKLTLDIVTAAVAAAVVQWHATIRATTKALALENFSIHFVCVPFPTVESFRRALAEELGVAEHVA